MYHDWLDDDTMEDITLPGLSELRGYWRGSLDASGGGNGDTMVSTFIVLHFPSIVILLLRL
jgi:hypothetical protein